MTSRLISTLESEKALFLIELCNPKLSPSEVFVRKRKLEAIESQIEAISRGSEVSMDKNMPEEENALNEPEMASNDEERS